jgi:acetylornithine/succinyldiaminopimelate/putrescine aminotransferase
MSPMKQLETLRKLTKVPAACGLSNEEVTTFLKHDPFLPRAIERAIKNLKKLQEEFPKLTQCDEAELLKKLPAKFLSFYPPETSSPYIPLSAQGPWIITYGGGVIYDTGGYGMIGHGHNPDFLEDLLSQPQVMANIMTPSFAQYRFTEKIQENIGHLHSAHACPYDRFIFMNSGSEAMAVALRISDAHAKRLTDPGAKHEGKDVKILSFIGSFHGRTYRAARISSSTRKKYDAALASFRDHKEHIEVEVNNPTHLKELFERLEKENCFIETVALEPVMGEGNPGCPLSREFYDTARELTTAHDSYLVIDSIQAGLRAHGVLSIVDYPGFEDCIAPDMEVYSKALNGGQYPLSVLALKQAVAEQYVFGTYGNTMTAAPRAIDVAVSVLNECTPELAKNIEVRGKEFVEKLEALKAEMPEKITKIQGTGLLVSAEIREDIPVVGFDGVEQRVRKCGVNVIHGGANALRFTPWFKISSEEIDLIIEKVRYVLEQY